MRVVRLAGEYLGLVEIIFSRGLSLERFFSVLSKIILRDHSTRACSEDVPKTRARRPEARALISLNEPTPTSCDSVVRFLAVSSITWPVRYLYRYTLTGTDRKRGKAEEDSDAARAETRDAEAACSRGACRCLGNAASRIHRRRPLSAIFDTAKNVFPLSLSVPSPTAKCLYPRGRSVSAYRVRRFLHLSRNERSFLFRSFDVIELPVPPPLIRSFENLGIGISLLDLSPSPHRRSINSTCSTCSTYIRLSNITAA